MSCGDGRRSVSLTPLLSQMLVVAPATPVMEMLEATQGRQLGPDCEENGGLLGTIGREHRLGVLRMWSLKNAKR